uniref:Uncharacterized protein n=1 Tax=Cannabis sativa TaxID=3483 RepID=A0A803P4P7_CANSA
MTSASSSLPQDPMVDDPDDRVLVITRISTNPINLTTPTTSAGTTNLATIAGRYLDPPNSNNWSDLPSIKAHAAPSTQGRTGGQTIPSTLLVDHQELLIMGWANQGQSSLP